MAPAMNRVGTEPTLSMQMPSGNEIIMPSEYPIWNIRWNSWSCATQLIFEADGGIGTDGVSVPDPDSPSKDPSSRILGPRRTVTASRLLIGELGSDIEVLNSSHLSPNTFSIFNIHVGYNMYESYCMTNLKDSVHLLPTIEYADE